MLICCLMFGYLMNPATTRAVFQHLNHQSTTPIVRDLMSFAPPNFEQQEPIEEVEPEVDRAKEVLAKLHLFPPANNNRMPISKIDEHVKQDQKKRQQQRQQQHQQHKRLTKEERLQINLNLYHDHMEKMKKLRESISGEVLMEAKAQANARREQERQQSFAKSVNESDKKADSSMSGIDTGHMVNKAPPNLEKEIQRQLRSNKRDKKGRINS